MATALTVAIISAAVSLVSVVFTVWSARGTARLQDELARRRESETREQQLDQLVKHYRDPLLLAAFDLQSRLFKHRSQRFLRVFQKRRSQ
jgi:biopolymer transport protein ExbB/TolQ